MSHLTPSIEWKFSVAERIPSHLKQIQPLCILNTLLSISFSLVTTISSSDVPFSSHLQSFPGSASFLVSQFFTSGGQSIGVSASASVLLMNIQDWFTLQLTGFSLDFSVFFSIYIQLVKSYTFYFKKKKKLHYFQIRFPFLSFIALVPTSIIFHSTYWHSILSGISDSNPSISKVFYKSNLITNLLKPSHLLYHSQKKCSKFCFCIQSLPLPLPLVFHPTFPFNALENNTLSCASWHCKVPPLLTFILSPSNYLPAKPFLML